MTNLNLYVAYKKRGIEECEQRVTFTKKLSLNAFLEYLVSDVLFIKINKEQPIIMWGKTNMSLFMDMSLETFFVDGNSISINIPLDVLWLQTDMETFDVKESDFIHETIPICKKIDDYEIFLIRNLLSQKECCFLIELGEKMTFKSIDYNKEYRSNDRLMATSDSLNHIIYNRLINYIPSKIGEWSICGLNSQFRFCRYKPGQLFTKHLDGRFIKSIEEKIFFYC